MHEIAEDTIVLCRPGNEDFWEWDKQQETRQAFCHFYLHSLPDDCLPEHAWPIVRAANEAEAACVSPQYLCLLFKKNINLTPKAVLNMAYLDRARELLYHSNMSIKEIAYECGFTDQRYFSRRFVKAFGMAPSQLRKAAVDGKVPQFPRLLRLWAP